MANNKAIEYEFVNDCERLKDLMNNTFDEFFWEDLLSQDDSIQNALSEGHEFILFTQEKKPCALVNMGGPFFGDEDSKEIYQLDVEDNNFGRGEGVGGKVVELLKTQIYPDKRLYGYSVSESAKFWVKHASKVDEDILQMFKDAHIEDGYEEDELYCCEGLMLFWL